MNVLALASSMVSLPALLVNLQVAAALWARPMRERAKWANAPESKTPEVSPMESPPAPEQPLDFQGVALLGEAWERLASGAEWVGQKLAEGFVALLKSAEARPGRWESG